MRTQYLLQCTGLNNTSMTPNGSAFFEQNQRRNTLNAVSGGSLLIPVDIDFDNRDAIADTAFHIFQNRFHGVARAAPIGVKIDQGGFFGSNELSKF